MALAERAHDVLAGAGIRHLRTAVRGAGSRTRIDDVLIAARAIRDRADTRVLRAGGVDEGRPGGRAA
jgi:hypothetical protein